MATKAPSSPSTNSPPDITVSDVVEKKLTKSDASGEANNANDTIPVTNNSASASEKRNAWINEKMLQRDLCRKSSHDLSKSPTSSRDNSQSPLLGRKSFNKIPKIANLASKSLSVEKNKTPKSGLSVSKSLSIDDNKPLKLSPPSRKTLNIDIPRSVSPKGSRISTKSQSVDQNSPQKLSPLNCKTSFMDIPQSLSPKGSRLSVDENSPQKFSPPNIKTVNRDIPKSKSPKVTRQKLRLTISTPPLLTASDLNLNVCGVPREKRSFSFGWIQKKKPSSPSSIFHQSIDENDEETSTAQSER